MTLGGVLAYGAAAVAFGLALLVVWRERRHVAYRAFAAGMIVFGLREVMAVFGDEALYEAEILRWHRLRLAAESFFPGLWLLFSLTFARANYDQFLKRWRLGWLAAFGVPLAIVFFGWESLVVRSSPYPLPSWLVPVGWSGYALHIVFLLSAVLILMNLESTLRASSGAVRWQIKFFVIGLGALFGVQLFLYSQVLLYSAIQTTLYPIGSGALLLASGLVVVALVRKRLVSFDVYPSLTFLYNSLTLLIVGIYLLAVAGLVEAIDAFGGGSTVPLAAFVVLVAIVALSMVLLSGELRLRAKRFLSRHLQRPRYDYRQIWDAFTRGTSSLVRIEPLCAAITKMAAETFGCSSASIWLSREGERKLVLGGSTATAAEEANSILKEHDDGKDFFRIMDSHLKTPVDLWEEKPSAQAKELFERLQARYCVALLGNHEEPIGFLTLNERITKQPFNAEDFALLKTFGDQAAATVLNRRLGEELQRAKEMEAFQTLSAFFIHDLKNLASRLSLAMQNLPAHFDKPAFRKYLLDTMAKSVSKIDSMTSRLSSVTKGLQIDAVECDLNALVEETLGGLNGILNASLSRELRRIPPLRIDRDQIQKVLINLLLNAQEATGESGRVTVSTSAENGWIELAVSDDGCGMSPEFMANSLFRPFQTTKKQGLGVGLFHCKKIVEAHGGRIEVESERGAGSTFRIALPVPRKEAR